LVSAIEVLQDAELIVSDLEREILPARVADYRPQDLDELLAAGEVVWIGKGRVGERDGRISLYLADSLELLLPTVFTEPDDAPLSPRAQLILDFLKLQGASFLTAFHAAAGAGFLGDTVDALWELVWYGRITNDTFLPVRSYIAGPDKRHARPEPGGPRPGSVDFLKRQRSRTGGHPAAQGRWSLVPNQSETLTRWTAATAQQLLVRNGIVSRETAIAENIPGGYPSIYPALRTMEEGGMVRRGMFVAGLGAAQFAMPTAVDLLRSLRNDGGKIDTVHLAASDPANPYGSLLEWPKPHSMSRTSGASVILVNGRLAAFFRRRNPSFRIFVPDDEPERTQLARELARQLADVALIRQTRHNGLLIGEINDQPAREHFIAPLLQDAGFVDTAAGFHMRRTITPIPSGAGPRPAFS
jgi:ATP-dependent Lhr-like helicase